MTPFWNSIISVVIVSLISLVGVATILLSKKALKTITIFLVAFSTGGLIGGAFFHLLPESVEMFEGSLLPYVYVMVGFSLFFVLEKILRWHHCHDGECHGHEHLGWMNLIGDTVHNFIDGMVIMAAFTAGPALGIPVTISIILHEIPQELGDLGVLLYAGFSRLKALLLNLLSALISIIGVVVAYLLINMNLSVEQFLLPFAAGGFLYIAASDLIPELHKETKTVKSVISFTVFVIALVFMYFIKVFAE